MARGFSRNLADIIYSMDAEEHNDTNPIIQGIVDEVKSSGVSPSLTLSTMLVLDSAAEMFADDLDRTMTFQGREGSIHAEDEILDSLLPYEGDGMRRMMDSILSLIGSEWRFSGFVRRGSDTEADKRDWLDVSVRMTGPGGDSVVPVNIKATHGGTADNLCSWMAYDYAVIGDDSPAKSFNAHARKMKRLGGILDDASENDYFVWTFFKDDRQRLTGGHESGSLLASRPGIDLRFNNAQSLPIQMFHGHDDLPEKLEYMKKPIRERRLALERWMMGNISRVSHSRGDKADGIIRMLDEEP